ncbi:S8 family peptidase [Infirmifilum sp. NZ]|uniref:S8 family peptidase n=1 Tax=Infirmifilum sp. NZ TaxID=2926850 RepID=UPI0027A13AB9|nr:S8 family serine peptidase [Infirmifilum sp. NZ]UNQ73391.1 S8 family serine peptidase [Infirmifilum sp. NZ]
MIIDPNVLSSGSDYSRVLIHVKAITSEVHVTSFNSKPRGVDIAEAVGIKPSLAESLNLRPIHYFGPLGVLSALLSPRNLKSYLDSLPRSVEAVEKAPVAYASLNVSVPLIGGDYTWESGFTGKGVRVAVIDSGVDKSHPDLRSRVVQEKSFTPEPPADYNGHGTHVAGIIASSHTVYRGVAPEAEIINAKALTSSGFGFSDDIIAAYLWSASEAKADVVNMSFGISFPTNYVPVILDKLGRFLNSEAKKGRLLFAAAGNAGPEPGTIDFPALVPGVIAVAATDKGGRVAPYSGSGSEELKMLVGELKPNIAAPGGLGSQDAEPQDNIISSLTTQISEYYKSKLSAWIIDDHHVAMAGTSMAAPHASGAAAVLLNRLRELGLDNYSERYPLVYGALAGTARDTGAPEYRQGHGLINLREAVRQLGKHRIDVPEIPPTFNEKLVKIAQRPSKTAREDLDAQLVAALIGAGAGILVGALAGLAFGTRDKIKGLLNKLQLAQTAYQAGLITADEYQLYAQYISEEIRKLLGK